MTETKVYYKSRKIIIRMIAFAIAAILFIGIFPLNNAALADNDGMIRVKLTRLGSSVSSIEMKTVGNYTIAGKTVASGSTVKVIKSGSTLTATVGGQQVASGTSICMNRTSGGTGTGVRFSSPSLDNLFCGDLTFSVSGNGIQTVLSIYIETYLYGVVPYEMSNSFPLEALKAQTIAARTYAMRAKRSSGSYDVTDNTSSQVFKGYNSAYGNAINAVDSTRGVVLMAGSGYAQCYYTASNGGQTESTANAWGGSNISYLTVKDDPYDRENPNSIVKSYSISRYPQKKALHSELEAALISAAASQLQEKGLSTSASDIKIEEIIDVEPHTPKFSTPSRTYTKVRFTMKLSSKSNSTGNQVSTQVEVDLNTYSSLQSMLNLSINSGDNEIVSVEKGEESFILSFSRYGHGIGLSQRGAQWMAKQYGMTYEEILSFYYPGTQQKTLSLKETISGNSVTAEPTATRVPEQTENGYTTLQEGDSGSAVKALQVRLKELGYFTGTPLGNYRTLTVAAVKAYQKAMNLTEDGIATPALQERIFGDQTTSSTPSPETTQAPTGDQVSATIVLSDPSSWLNVREKGSTSAKVVGKLQHGAKVTILSATGDWYQISSGSISGYVKENYLQVTQDSSDSELEGGEYTTLQYGDSSEAVRALQEQLKEMGYFTGTPLGNYRTQTTNAVQAYQEAMGLEPDGIATPELQAMIFAGMTPSATNQPDESGKVQATVSLSSTSSRLNVRKSPSTSAGIVGTLQHGTKVDVFESVDGWSKIETNTLTGYVMTSYLSGIDGALPASTPQPTVEATETPEAGTAVVKLNNASSRLNIRKSPSTASAVIGSLRHGMQVEVLETSGGWSRLRSGNTIGYVKSSYLTMPDGTSLIETPNATSAPDQETQSGTAVIQLRSASSRLNVRKEATTSSSIVGTLKHGEEVEVLAVSGDWSRIKSGGLTGYVMKSYLIANSKVDVTVTPQPTSAGVSIAGTSATIQLNSSSSKLNVRKEATTSSSIVGQLIHGASVEVLSRSGEWSQIKNGNLIGYVMTSYLKEESDTTSAPEQDDSSDYTTLSYGDSGEAVKRLQTKLRELGYFSGELGGNYLKLTRAAVEAYQSEHGWTVDGIATAALQKEIFESMESADFSSNAVVTVGVDAYLNLRKSASTSSQVLATMKHGERIYAESAEDGWYRVKTGGGLTGYAKQEYIQLD